MHIAESTTGVKNFFYDRAEEDVGERIGDDPSCDGYGDEEKSQVWWARCRGEGDDGGESMP